MDRLVYRVAELYRNGGRITSELVAELCRNTQLIAPEGEYHPLVFNQGLSPLENFNLAMKQYSIEFKILPYTLDDKKGFDGWVHNKIWPEASGSV